MSTPVSGARGVLTLRILFVNVHLVSGDRPGSWVLVDAGLPGSTDRIVRTAERRFGRGVPPVAIVLTHGHFDHVGALGDLLERWDAPVLAHPLELPYLTGRSPYPPPDPAVGGGAMSFASRLFSRGPIDVGARVRPLPIDGTLPGLADWRWIATPGHSPGHVSLIRAGDGTIVSGDAVVTTRQESLASAITYRPELHGPPAYFTPDWQQARASVERIAALRPNVLTTGHGPPVRGAWVPEGLAWLAENFDRVVLPRRGRYVRRPARVDETGVVALPPPVTDPVLGAVAAAGLGALTGLALGAATAPRTRPEGSRASAAPAQR
ncbi:MAG TPA: MBL fold metallo-hydrolase [Gemmatimonadales bacterium]|jgi:glyoxylase-like metal-dependent hydrolase (beta-lactamase superfamily II)|nr:MBL fold metallo-hydrolase [Gemmatimonadales bacterium]